MFKIKSILLLALASTSIANATIVTPGSVVNLFGTTNFAQGGALAAVVRNDMLMPFTLSDGSGGYMGGIIQNRVTQLNTDSTLVFAPRIRDIIDLASNFEFSVITGFQLTGFSGFSTDIEYRTDGSGDDGPDNVSRSMDGDTLTFRFDPSHLDLNEESYFPSINTDATQFDLSGTMTIFGQRTIGQGSLDSITITGIASPVPVPATYLLFSSAITLLGLAKRRKNHPH